MHRIRRAAVAALAAAALVTTPLAISSAEAAGHGHSASSHGARGASAQVRAVTKQVIRLDRALTRLSASRTITRLEEDHELVLVESISADRDELAALEDDLVSGATAARSARATLRSFRVENYRKAVSVLRGADELAALAVDEPEVLDLVDLATAAALAVTATSPRADLKVARQLLEDAWEVFEAIDSTDDSTDDGTGGEEPV